MNNLFGVFEKTVTLSEVSHECLKSEWLTSKTHLWTLSLMLFLKPVFIAIRNKRLEKVDYEF